MPSSSIPVWVHAPLGRDAALLKSSLAGSEAPVRIAREASDLRRAFAEPGQVGVLILTREGLTHDVIALLLRHTSEQPAWSTLPILLLVNPTGNSVEALSQLQDAVPRANLLVLQRPLRPSEIESAVGLLRQSRRRQYGLRDHLEQQERLRRELNHRVKNILATVQALYGLTARGADDLESFGTVFQGRLQAMSQVHEVLYAHDYGTAPLGGAIEAVLAPYAGDPRLEADGPALALPAETVQSLALVVHELVTNAVKYGALSSEAGKVSIAWSRRAHALNLTWDESGGPPVVPPTRSGYGTSFVRATVRGLGGDAVFDYDPAGLRVRLKLPVGEGATA